MASATDSFNWLTASVRMSGKLVVGDVPGLKSVASATAHPASMNARAGACAVLPRKNIVPGSSVATVPARARRLDAGVAHRGEGDRPDVARSSAASSAPPPALSSSACSLMPSPGSARAATRISRALVGGEHTGLTEHVGENWRAAPRRSTGSISRITSRSRYSRRPRGRSRNSIGISCAPRNVATMRSGIVSWRVRMTRSVFSSSSSESP